MSPVEALCFQCIKSWVRIVQYKKGSCGEIDSDGTPWTRCSATEVQSWIASELECEVSARQCQNALRSLEASGRVIREKRWANRWTQAYSYTVRSTDLVKPTQQVAKGQSDVPPEANLSSSSTSSSTAKSAVASKGPRVMEPSRAPAPAASDYRSTGMSSSLTRIEGIPSSRSLSQIKELCERLGNGELPLPNEVPQAYVDALSKRPRPQ